MSVLWACCDCLCPPTSALRKRMVSSRADGARAGAGAGVDNAAYQPDEPVTDPAHRQPSQGETILQTAGSDSSLRHQPQEESCSVDHYNIRMPSEVCPVPPHEHPSQECQRPSSPGTATPLSRQMSQSCQLEDIREVDEEETTDAAGKAGAEKYVVAAAGPAAQDEVQASSAPPKKRRASMFQRKSQSAGPASADHERRRPWRRRSSRLPDSTGEFSAELSDAEAHLQGEQHPKRTRRFSLWGSPDSGASADGSSMGAESAGHRERRGSRLLGAFRRRGSRHESESGHSACDENEDDDGQKEFELAAAAAALKRWKRQSIAEFDNDAPLSTHWDFLESVKDDFAKVDAKAYAEHKQYQTDQSSSSSEEEVPNASEAQLMLRLSESKNIHPDKVEKLEERRHSLASSASEAGAWNAAPSKQPHRYSITGAWFNSHESTSPEDQKSTVTDWFLQKPRASSCPPPDTDANSIASDRSLTVKSDQADMPGAKAEGDNTSVSSFEQRLSEAPHRSRHSIFNRLFPSSGRQRRTSLPATSALVQPPSPPQVRAATWFHQQPPEQEPEMEQVETPTPQMFRQRRATVADISLRSFLDDVDVKTKALREKEFQGPDLSEVQSPGNIEEDDDHIIPIFDSNRCVQLMMEEAEKRLETEYINSHSSPDPHMVPGPSDVLASFSMSKAARQDTNTDTAIPGSPKLEQMDLAVVLYQPVIPHQLVGHDHDRDTTAGASTSQQPSPSSPSDIHRDAVYHDVSEASRIVEDASPTASKRYSEDKAEAKARESPQDIHSSAAPSTPQAESQSVQASADTLSQHAQTSLEALKPAVDSQSVQTPQLTHPPSSPAYAEDDMPRRPSAGEPVCRLPSDRETAPSLSNASSQTPAPPGPSVGTSTWEDRDRKEGLHDVEGAEETSGGLSWEVVISDSRRCLDDRGTACGVGRHIEVASAAALGLELEKQQQAAADRRDQLLHQRSNRAAELAEGPRARSHEDLQTTNANTATRSLHNERPHSATPHEARAPTTPQEPPNDMDAEQSSPETEESRWRQRRREQRTKREQQLSQWRSLTSDEDEDLAARAMNRHRRPGKQRADANSEAAASVPDATPHSSPTSQSAQK